MNIRNLLLAIIDLLSVPEVPRPDPKLQFENLQRILNHHSNCVIAITTAWFSLNGFGLFSLLADAGIGYKIISFGVVQVSNRYVFSVMMLLGNILLTFIWLRERRLGRSARRQLKVDFDVSVDEDPKDQGLAGRIWMVYVLVMLLSWACLIFRYDLSGGVPVFSIGCLILLVLSLISIYSRYDNA